MACANSFNYVWEQTDNSYIQATKSGGRTPVCRRLFPQTASENDRPGQKLQKAKDESGFESDDASVSSCSMKDFDAIPEEFRPSKQGKGLMKVRTSPKKEPSKEKVEAKLPLQKGGFPSKPNVSQRRRDTRNPNSSSIQNETKNHKKELLENEESGQPHRDTCLTSDDSEEQKKSGVMFFFSTQNESTSNATSGCQKSWSERENSRDSSEKSELKNLQDKDSCRRFYGSDSQSKATNDFQGHSFFRQHNMEPNFNKCNTDMPPEFRERNSSNQSKDNNETNSSKYNKSIPPKFQDRTGSNQNGSSFGDKGAQKVTREVTVEKRIKWKNDLCEFKKPETKPDYFYEYTKTTKKSVSYVSSHSDINEKDEITKKPNQNFRNGRKFYKNFRHTNFSNNKRQPEDQKDKGFDSTSKDQGNDTKPLFQWKSPKPANEFEEIHTCLQCGNSKEPIIIKHEIRVIHESRQGRNNRAFHNSPQTFRPLNKNRNGKTINYDPRERNGKIMNADTRERNGKVTNTYTRVHCNTQITENTMTKTAETVQKLTTSFVKPPLNSAFQNDPKRNTISSMSNSKDAAALIKYGKEISDLIAGSYITITTFLDNYEQWKDLRRVTMLLFGEVEKNLSQSRNKNKTVAEVAGLVGTGCKIAQLIPQVSVAAKIIAALSDVIVSLFSSSKLAKSIDMDDFQLRLCLQRDMEATTDIYVCGQQCDFQFQETRQLIEEFHRQIQARRFEEFEETFETGFLKEISQLSPKNPEVFYKKLGRIYKFLNDQQQSEEGAAFCGAFEDWPDALTTVSRLHRRFKAENWESSSVIKAWEEVYNLLQNDKSTVDDILKKIQDCICVLMREQSIMEKYVMDLQRQA